MSKLITLLSGLGFIIWGTVPSNGNPPPVTYQICVSSIGIVLCCFCFAIWLKETIEKNK
jgi:hypothetical protein